MEADARQRAAIERALRGTVSAELSTSPFDGERVVAGKREVDLYVRTYTTLLQSTGSIKVSSLEPAHLTAGSALHAGALERYPDLNAFIYSIQRLPGEFASVASVVLG
ncbi:MAG: DUF6909 family protein, partial [Chloroflexota bacterium]